MAQNLKEYKKITLFLICIVLLKIAFTFLGNNYSYFSLRDFFTSVLNTENIVSLTNESRKAVGLNVLKVNPKLESAAQKKAEDMLKNQYFSHTSPSGKLAWDFMDDAGYVYLFAGENLAMDFTSAEDVTSGWLASVSHKENILSDKYTQIGIGVTTGKFFGAQSTIVVQMFGKPLRSSALISTIAPTTKTKMSRQSVAKQLLSILDWITKRPVRLALLTTAPPVAKNVSVKKYISKLVQDNVANWMPSASTHEIYALSGTNIPTKSLLDMLFAYVVACGIGVLAWRFFKEKYYRNKVLGIYTFLVMAISLVLVNL